MTKLSFFLVVAVALTACGESSAGGPRTGGELCDEICGWPDQCFAELGVPLEGADCIQSCEASAEVVGLPCLQAINSTVACLGTCDFDALTEQQILNCQDEAQAISVGCE